MVWFRFGFGSDETRQHDVTRPPQDKARQDRDRDGDRDRGSDSDSDSDSDRDRDRDRDREAHGETDRQTDRGEPL